MKSQYDALKSVSAAMVFVAVLLAPGPARPQFLDDAILFTAVVPPNVLLLLDNSGSMNNVLWHSAFDPTQTPTCAQFSNTETYYVASSTDLPNFEIKKGNHTYCGNTRDVFEDTATGSEATQWNGRYLNWYFSNAANVTDPATGNTYATDIQASNNATTSGCVGGPKYSKWKRVRISALRQSMLEVTCEVNAGRGAADGLRFGTAQFRPVVSNSDPNGGFVGEGIDDNTPQHANDMEAHIGNLKADTWTPLGEALFQMYTYFMSRTATDRPFGYDPATGLVTGTRFPGYVYDTVSGDNDSSKAPPDPVQYSCQKNFIIVVTDGEPTRDDFDEESNTDEALGFSDFDSKLIGDYNADGETEVAGGSEGAWYLDDIAKFMQDKDFRPDFDGDQVIDTYTVGFSTTPTANALLSKTADVGNGLFFYATDPDELKAALLAALVDIIEKTQSFTASTVPASRTVNGADFYTSFFLPLGADPFWQGHLQAYHITAGGDITDKNDVCALADPTVGECNSGPFLPSAEPFWDAGSEIPSPGSRTLYVSKLDTNTPPVPYREDFTAAAMAYTDLELDLFAADGDATTPAPNRTYAGSIALNEEGLADEIVEYERGCEFGTGVSGANVDALLATACVDRAWLLGDIFHSNPLLVRKPGAFILEPSYEQFKTTYAARERVIYAGSNDGFLHGFEAGDWVASPAPGAYDEGSGVEKFGFMPWWVRKQIKFHYTKNGATEHYQVDGSPEVADVWFHSTPTTTAKASSGSEWHTVLAGGLRQGGNTYYALDVTNPAGLSYPGYLWEFPTETDLVNPLSMGQTWGTPIMTKIKVRVGTDGNPDAGGVDQGYERWVVVVTAGYDEAGNPNHPSYVANGSSGRGIFVLDAKTGEVIAFRSIASAATGDAEGYAAPTSPAVLDIDFDGYADLIYFGDLGGNLWKWVINPIGDDCVNSVGACDLSQAGNWPFKKFFVSPRYQDSGTWLYKSFFFPPSATLYRGKLYVALGTGERTDLGFEGPTGTDDDNNRFYVMTDLDPMEHLASPLATLAESDLTDLTADASCQAMSGRGFYFVAENGEKFVTNSEIFARDVIAAAFTPTDLADPCETGGGEAALYVFDVICSEGFFDDGGTPTRKIDLGKGFPTDPRISAGVDGQDNIVFIEKSRAEVESIIEDDLTSTGSLLYWRERQ